MNATRARRNLEQFLNAQGVLFVEFVDIVHHLAPDGSIVVTGSVPEGLANCESDIDVLVLGEDHLRAERVMRFGETEHAFNQSHEAIKLHIRTLTATSLEILSARVNDGLLAFGNPEASKRLDLLGEDDLRTLHRIRTGVCIRGDEVVSNWRDRLRCDYLPHYMVTLNVGEHISRREDAIGEAREGRIESSAWALRDALSHLACGILAAIGEGHPSSKWCVRLVQTHRDVIGRDLADMLVSHLIAPRWIEFSDYLTDVLEFADTVLASILLRRPEIVPLLLELQKEIGLTTLPDRAPQSSCA